MSQSTPAAPNTGAGRRQSGLLSSEFAAELSLFVVLVVMVVMFSLASPFFLTWTNMVNLGQTVAASGIVAIAMTLVIISGGIDLSVGSVAALAGVLTSLLWTYLGVPLVLAALLGILSGLVVGAVNGLMVTRIKISPLIATLATFSIVRGLAFVISNGQTNQLNNDAFKFLGRGAVAGVPFSLLILIGVYVLFSFLLSQTRFGRDIFAIGGNAEASRLAGIRINRTLLWVYLISGVTAGCAGILIASQLALSAPRAAMGLELTAIAAVVLGGTSLSGGKGTLLGTILGVLILRILDNGLVLLNVSSFYQDVASGLVLLLAVGFDQLRTRLGDRIVSADPQAPILQMRSIEKSFFGVRVLKGVDFDLFAGEVHALLGENGAGKSTLIKILNGDYTLDAGEILLDGAATTVTNPRDAEMLGIRMIYQELHYAPDLSVTENLLLGHLPLRKGLLGAPVVDWAQARRTTVELLQLLGIDLDVRTPMRKLSAVERQIVQIAKALSTQARILVMDEPTAALPPHEVDLLFDIIRTLRRQGVGIIYISHRLDEIFQIAQRATVLRDGALVATETVAALTKPQLVHLMVGRELGENWSRLRATAGAEEPLAAPLLQVTNLTQRRNFHDVSLAVRPGEIVGVFGLLGAGHAHLTRAVFGAERVHGGTIEIAGRPVSIRSPRDGLRHDLGLVPADRKVEGLVLERSVMENITLSNWRHVARAGFFRRTVERNDVTGWIDRLGIRMAGGMDVKIRYLSGGNQQKALLARWLEAQVKVLLLNEPTWGVDVGARFDIYELLEELAHKGLAILLVSSDIQEVLAVSHRILTMYRGELTAEFSQADASQEKLLRAAAGVGAHE